MIWKICEKCVDVVKSNPLLVAPIVGTAGLKDISSGGFTNVGVEGIPVPLGVNNAHPPFPPYMSAAALFMVLKILSQNGESGFE